MRLLSCRHEVDYPAQNTRSRRSNLANVASLLKIQRSLPRKPTHTTFQQTRSRSTSPEDMKLDCLFKSINICVRTPAAEHHLKIYR